MQFGFHNVHKVTAVAEESGHTDTELSRSVCDRACRATTGLPQPGYWPPRVQNLCFKKGSLLNMCYKMSLDDYVENRCDEETICLIRMFGVMYIYI